MAELQIKIGADVSSAISGLNRVQSELEQTGSSASALTSSVNKAASNLSKLPQAANNAGTAVGNLSRIVQDAPFGFIAISNNLQPLFDDFTRLKGQTGSVGGALKALTGAITGPAGIGLAFAAATSLITIFSKELFSSGQAADKAKSDADRLRDSIKGIYSETAKEATSVSGFVAILNSETETRQRKLEAIKELQAIQPEVFNGLKLEGEAIVGLDAAYTNYLANLKNVLAVKIKQAQQEQLIEKLLKAEGVTLTSTEKTLVEGTKKVQQALANDPRVQGGDAAKLQKYYKDQENQSAKATQKLKDDIQSLQKDITELSKGVETKPINIKGPKSDNLKNTISNTIAEAKKIADATDQTIDLKLNINPLDTEKEQYTKAKEFLGKWKAGLYNIALNLPPAEIEVPVTFSDEKNLKGASVAGQLYAAEFARATQKASIGVSETLLVLDAQALLKKQGEIRKLGEDIANAFNDGLKSISVEGISAIGQGIGKALAGGDIRSAFEGFASALGGGLEAIGKQLIGIGTAALLAKEALKKLFANPALAIAAGVALVAAGSAMQSVLSKGLPARANGGPVSGNSPYLVGERGPELFVPAVSGSIVPNSQVGSMMNGRAGNNSGRSSVLRGQDILLAYARTQRSQLRVNG